MNINDLIAIVKKKLINNIVLEKIDVGDKSFLHKNHSGNKEGKYHLKIIIKSYELQKLSRVDSNKKIYKILNEEIENNIHSLQILIT